jgi:hypothetical protein
MTLVAVGIVAAGSPARGTSQDVAEAAQALEVEVDPASLPEVTVSRDAQALNSDVDPGALALMLAEDLSIEAEAMRRADTSLLRGADDGERLVTMERKIEVAATAGELVVAEHRFDSLHLDVVFTDGPQGGASLGFQASGTVDEVTYDQSGSELARSTSVLDKTFVLRKGPGDRWLIIAEVEG